MKSVFASHRTARLDTTHFSTYCHKFDYSRLDLIGCLLAEIINYHRHFFSQACYSDGVFVSSAGFVVECMMNSRAEFPSYGIEKTGEIGSLNRV